MSNPAVSEDQEAEDEAAIRARIRDRTRPPEQTRELPRVGSEVTTSDRVPFPVRLPRMYYESLKEWSEMTGQSMNSLTVEAVGRYLREI